MYLWAVRTYEPWSAWTILAGILLMAGLVAVLIVVVRRSNR
jgi:hypothetical protein